MSGQGQGEGQADVRTSASPAVSVVTERIAALDRHLTSEIAALRRESQAAQATAQRAVGVAEVESKERLKAHNGLIEQMREKDEHFASRDQIDDVRGRLTRIERFQSMLIGGMALTGFIGFASLIKIYTG